MTGSVQATTARLGDPSDPVPMSGGMTSAPGGGEVVKLMGTSAWYAPSAGTVEMVEAIVRDKKRLIPCAAYCNKEYGVGGFYVGVPVVLGAAGVERIIMDRAPGVTAVVDDSVTE